MFREKWASFAITPADVDFLLPGIKSSKTLYVFNIAYLKEVAKPMGYVSCKMDLGLTNI
jgi:hypothetical protein